MSVILLLVLFFLYLNFRTMPQDWRLAVVSAAVVFGVMVVSLTEVLSVVRLLTRPVLFTCWSVVLLVLVVIWWARGGRPAWPALRVTPISLGIAAVFAVIGVIAWASPPNTWDAMTYHMTRVWMWAHYASVAHYPVFDTRQLYNPPLTEFIQLHIYLLDDADRAVNMVQWAALGVGAIAASLSVARLRGGPHAQMLAAAFSSTIPIAIQQASGAKNDLLVAVWALCLLSYVVALIVQPHATEVRWWVLGAAFCAALATLTKPTGYLYALPILLWLGITWLLARRWSIFNIAGAVLVAIFLLNGPHFFRNWHAFGNPISDPADASEITVEKVTLPGTVSIAARNLLLNVPMLPSTRSTTNRGLKSLHTWLGLDINAAVTTFESETFQFVRWSGAFLESRTPNPLHLTIIVATFVLLLLRFRSLDQFHFSLGAVVIAQALLLSSLLAWQPWGTRLQLGIFLTGGVFVAVVFHTLLPGWVIRAASVTLLFSALPWLLMGHPRSLITSTSVNATAFTSVSYDDAYFLSRQSLAGPTRNLLAHLATIDDCSVFALYMGDEWQYPALRGAGLIIPDLEVQHLDARDPLFRYYELPAFSDFKPCRVLDTAGDIHARIEVQGQLFERTWRDQMYNVYAPVAP